MRGSPPTGLWLPGSPLLDSREAFALEDLDPPAPIHPDPWRDR